MRRMVAGRLRPFLREGRGRLCLVGLGGGLTPHPEGDEGRGRTEEREDDREGEGGFAAYPEAERVERGVTHGDGFVGEEAAEVLGHRGKVGIPRLGVEGGGSVDNGGEVWFLAPQGWQRGLADASGERIGVALRQWRGALDQLAQGDAKGVLVGGEVADAVGEPLRGHVAQGAQLGFGRFLKRLPVAEGGGDAEVMPLAWA